MVRDQVGCPTWTGHLAAGIVRLLDTDAYGLHHMSAQGECSWYDFAMAIFEEAGVDCRVLSTTTAEFARPAPRPAYSVLGTQWQDAIHLPEWQVGLRGYLEDRVVKLLVTGAAGFIGSTFVRLVAGEHEVVVLDKLTYAGRRENLEGVEHTLVEGAIEDPVKVREAMEGADAVVNFAAESHVDRSIEGQDPFAVTHVIGTGTLLEAARELGVGRYLQVSTDEVYGSIDSGSFTETSPLDPSSPYSRHQGRRRPAGVRARPHARHRGRDLPRHRTTTARASTPRS